MANTPTNGGGIPAGRLPPQAPSSSSRLPPPDSSRRPKGGKKGRSHARSSSEGVRAMNQSYQQQQQNHQYYYASGGGYENNQYPMQHSNQPPPPPVGYGYSPQGMRKGNSGGTFEGPDPSYGSIPPRPRSSSRDSREGGFSAMNELSSVIGISGSTSRGSRRPSPGKGKHRRSSSDSMAQQVQRSHQFNPNNPSMGVPNMGVPNMGVPNNPNMRVVYPAGDSEGEMSALLAQRELPGNRPSGRPSSHMRQNSVNNFMKSFKGEKQSNSCKDIFWCVLFIAQLLLMCLAGLKFGPEALVETDADLGPGEGMENDDVLDSDLGLVLAHQNIIKMAYTCGAFAIIVSALALAFMMAMSRRLVYVALVLSIGVSFAWGTIGIGISPKSFVPITGIISLMLTVGYMFVVWDRIPFASANLTTALTGVRDNLGLVGVAFFFQFLALVASIYYSFTFVGLHNVMRRGDVEYDDQTVIAVSLMLLVSYYWTYQVLRHIVMVTVAGTIRSWWFDEPSCLKETFITAIFYNFGSICQGSLFVGFVQFLRQITEGFRPNHGESSMMCLVEFTLYFQERIVNCVDKLADSFTPWAFSYVGMYHYGLKEAGHKANELFDKRGWSRIVTDDLISSVLAMVSLVIGGLSGSFAVILQALDGHGLTSFGHPVLTSFTIGFVVGIVLSTVLFSIIDSSVCAVIVCFAGSPVEFHRNYPELSHEMRNAWKEVWPGSLDHSNMGGGLV